jgi:hypothetical protein
MPKSHTKSHTKSKTKTKASIKNKKGGGGAYSSDDYKDIGVFDNLKFATDNYAQSRADLPPFPGCSIL